MTRRRLLLASMLATWVAMVIACAGTGSHETEAEKAKVQTKDEAATTNEKKVSSEVTTKAATEEKVSPPPSEAPRPTVKLVPIKSYPIVAAWRQASALKGQRVRLTGEAEVKRSVHGVYAVFKLATGRKIAVVSVKNDDAQPLLDIKVGESETMSVNLETTVKGTSEGWYLALDDSEFLPLDAPEGFALVEEPPAEMERTTVAKDQGQRPASVSSPGSNPPTVSNSPPINTPTFITSSSHMVGTGSKTVHVRGYYRQDGTYVREHSRAAPGMGTYRRR